MTTMRLGRAGLPAVFLAAFAFALAATTIGATETENFGIRVLPAPGQVVIDGKIGDWDLSGGVFICGDVENRRDDFALWYHLMYDARNLYILARWVDATPMDHPGSVKGSYGFHGDCLQARFITDYEGKQERVSHWTCWRDRDGLDVLQVAYGRDFKGGSLRDAKDNGAQQAFQKDADGKGYVQEIAIPWGLLTKDGSPLTSGQSFITTVEPNFTRGASGRLTIKDLFHEGHAPDRVFTFRAYKDWGVARLEARGNVKPQPLRLADGREFVVSMADGLPRVDWTGLIQRQEPKGFKDISFDMPFDGYVSLNLYDAQGVGVRALLTAAFYTAGKQTVKWDALTDPYFRAPGAPVAAGTYTWKAIAHPGVGIRLRGWADNGGSLPWSSGPASGWGGNHGVPCASAADADKVYLGWSQAEGPSPLVACDLQGNVQWHSGMGGKDQALFLAVDGGTVYAVFNGGTAVFRADAKAGSFTAWEGTDDSMLSLAAIWPDKGEMPDIADGMDAAAGRLYLSFSSARITEQTVTDWPAFLKALTARKGRVAADLMDGLRGPAARELDGFARGRTPADKVSRRPILGALNALLNRRDLVAGAENLKPIALQHANYAVLQAEFPGMLAERKTDLIAVLDNRTGKFIKALPVPGPTALAAAGRNRLLVVSNNSDIISVDTETGSMKTLVRGLGRPTDVAADAAGNIFVTDGAPDNQVKVFSPDGRPLRAIGRKGGRPPLGPWVQDGMLEPSSLVVDAQGKVWVTESTRTPKRVSVWNGATGAFVKEFFGPTHYGASGGAINPKDPSLMVGSGCEWRIDAKTGRASCLGVFDDTTHGFAAFREAANGKLYLFTIFGRYFDSGLRVFERLGDGTFARRTEVRLRQDEPNDPRKQVFSTVYWADQNGDGVEQPGEVVTVPGGFNVAGSNRWSACVAPDMTLYGQNLTTGDVNRVALEGFTPCGAPKYAVERPQVLPVRGYGRNQGCLMPTIGGDRFLVNLNDDERRAWWCCYDATGTKLLWRYPNPFFQVHGSHRAPPPTPGLFRGAFGIIGVAKMPGAAGDLWFINTNCGEWHVLTGEGFYLTRLFEGDPLKWKWPEQAVPGVEMDSVPCGSGGEDFGGSVTQADDGKVYLQSGKAAYWNLETTGLDKVVAIPGGTVEITAADIAMADECRKDAIQEAAGVRRVVVRKLTPAFTGDLAKDFPGCTPMEYEKQKATAVRTVAAWDDQNLYVGWAVDDQTPWVNGAKEPRMMYAGGDTVDLQLGTDPAAPADRREAARGDLRLSIGNWAGKPTAVLYRLVSDRKEPATFSSGVVPKYVMDYVAVQPEVKVALTVQAKRGYVLEAAIPLHILGFAPKPGMKLRGDFGVTHSDPAGEDTVLRTYWSNQTTGLIDDVVFELKMEPRNWGEIVFSE